jgi:hypothetical protein
VAEPTLPPAPTMVIFMVDPFLILFEEFTSEAADASV